MKKSSVPLYKGKNKTQVVEEAFAKLGANATRREVDAYAKKNYGISKPIESSMYYTLKARARQVKTVPVPVPAPVQEQKRDVWAVLRQVKALADEVGGTERLKELVELANAPLLDRLAAFAEKYGS